MGIVAATTLGRVWLMATAVLLVGVAERETGLAAAILLAASSSPSPSPPRASPTSSSPRAGGSVSADGRSGQRRGQPEALSTKAKVLIGLGIYFAIAILLLLIFGNAGKNEAFQPQNEFKLEPWISIHLGGIDLSINKAVLYLVLASALTIFDDGLDLAPHGSRSRTGFRPRSRSPTT